MIIGINSAREYATKCHADTNHRYDSYLPYLFHLKMTVAVFEEYKHLLDDTVDYYTGKVEHDRGIDNTETLREVCEKAAWGHDLIEDTRETYNDVASGMGYAAANVVYALTNEKGKNRKERANDKYYEGIRNTKGAVFVKLCDRIANVRYSKMTRSKMFDMYKKENIAFNTALRNGLEYPEMWYTLNELFV